MHRNAIGLTQLFFWQILLKCRYLNETFFKSFSKMYRQHSPDDLRHIAGRLKSVVKIIEKIADDMGKVNCETLKLQSDTIVNTRLPYIEQWVMETSGKAQSQLHKLALDQAVFQLGQQYAASKSAEKPQKTPGKRGGSGGGKR